MKQREQSIPPEGAPRLPEALDRRIGLKYALRACRLRAVEVLDGEAAASSDEVRGLRPANEVLAARVAEQAELPGRRAERPAGA